MRSAEGSEAKADCEDPMIKAACLIDDDSCPAECKESSSDEKEDTVVRSGDLSVTATAAEGKKVLKNGISDMDTITFKTSENVEISKITLERYGYNSDDSDKITGIWLEDQDGNVIAESKTLSKDKVTLNIKKDYRKVDGTYVATIVIQTANASLGTIGFKVTDVEHTAKNLNLDNYSPYTYEVIDYTGSEVTVEVKGSVKDYNYEEGESYEIARLKLKATNKDVLVKGFTLTNNLKGEVEKALDMGEFLDELTVTVDSKEIKAKASVNKDDELVISFNEDVEIAMNKSALFVISASFKDFDAYGDAVKYEVAKTSDVNAVEKKNETRVELDITKAAPGIKHTFAGGKIKLSNKKLGNVDAAQASEGTVIAEGEVTVTEPLSKLNFYVNANGNGAQFIDNLIMVVNGEEYDATKAKVYDFTSWGDAACTATPYGNGTARIDGTSVYVITNSVAGWADKTYTYADGTTDGCYVLNGTAPDGSAITNVWVKPVLSTTAASFNFKNVEIEKSGKVQFKVDIKDDNAISAGAAKTIEFSTFNKAAFDGAKYDNTNKYVQQGDVAGSISFSKVTLQPAKAALENNLTKDVEFLQNETARKTVFEGTYTAKKGDINLNKFSMAGTSLGANNKVTFYLSIDGEEVADTDNLAAQEETFSDVLVKAGETAKIKVEAEVEAYGDEVTTAKTYTIEIKGTDANGNEDTGKASDTTVGIKIKAKGSVTIPSTTEAKTALLKAQNQVVAKFTVKPSNGNEGLTLEDLELTIAGNKVVNNTETALVAKDIRVKVGGVEEDADDETLAATKYSVNEEIPTEGIVVEVVVKPEALGKVTLTVDKVNGKPFGTSYDKYFVPSLVTFVKQDEGSTSTEYALNVEHADDAYSIDTFDIYADCGNDGKTLGTALKNLTDISDDESFTIMRPAAAAAEICAVVYHIKGGDNAEFGSLGRTITIYKVDYKDYFKVGGKELAIPKA